MMCKNMQEKDYEKKIQTNLCTKMFIIRGLKTRKKIKTAMFAVIFFKKFFISENLKYRQVILGKKN